MSKLTEREILLRLYRKFGKDEVVSILKQKLADAEYKNGELLSEIEELKSLDFAHNKTRSQYLDMVKMQCYENKRLKSEINKWRSEYYSLKLKTDRP